MALAPKQTKQTPSKSIENGVKCNDHFIIEIPNDLESFLPKGCCIYRIPNDLRHLNKEAYTPRFISIGPIHHGKAELGNIEKQKYVYLQKFLDRTEKKLETFVDFIKEREENIRRCYSEHFDNLDREKYVTMALLDAFFIFELFIRASDEKNREYEDDPLLHSPWLRYGIQLDLILLENQLPFSDIVALYNFAFNDNPILAPFSTLTAKYFWENEGLDMNNIVFQDILHFTDFVRKKLYQKPKSESSESFENLKFAANELSAAGIKFENAIKNKPKPKPKDTQEENAKKKPNKHTQEEENDKNIMEQDELNLVSFDRGRGVLKLPLFRAYDTTEYFYRNLMALEQCHYPDEAYICSYILLMDFLINSNKDVAFLVKKGIIFNGLGSSQAVADMVNNLCRNVAYNNFYYQKICYEMNEYCDNWLHHCAAVLNGEYFKDVWHGTGTVVGTIVLVLTFINSIWSVMQIIGVKVD